MVFAWETFQSSVGENVIFEWNPTHESAKFGLFCQNGAKLSTAKDQWHHQSLHTTGRALAWSFHSLEPTITLSVPQ